MRLVLYLSLLVSCQSVPFPNASLPDADYFPLKTGYFKTYTVTEQVYRAGQPATTRQYEWRESTGAPFRLLTGDTAYVCTYAHRTNSSLPWHVDSIGSVRRTAAEVLLTTGGQTLVKLTFPAFDGQRWNGNRYNSMSQDEFQLQHCHQPFRTDSKAFDQTVTVLQQNDSTLVSQDKRIELFAYQIGLVYAERQQVHFCGVNPGCGQPSAIAYGIKQFIRLTEYGKE